MPIERYGPNLKAFWLKAVQEPQKLRLPNRPQTVALRHRLYRFRKELYLDWTKAPEGESKHELKTLYDASMRVTLRHTHDPVTNSVADPTKDWLLVASHSDDQFDKLLADQGFSTPEAPEPPPD